jgi:preprotein translocase subunit YajC
MKKEKGKTGRKRGEISSLVIILIVISMIVVLYFIIKRVLDSLFGV